MAVYKAGILQATGVEYLKLEEVDDTMLEPGLHYFEGVYSITIDGDPKTYTHDNWSIITLNYKGNDVTRTQLWFPIGNEDDTSSYYVADTLNYFFYRTRSSKEPLGGWGSFRKFCSGESVRGVASEEHFYLVNNDDPNHPIVMMDRTKMDKYLGGYSYAGGSSYKVGDIIPTNSPLMNAIVIEVDGGGTPTKIALTEEYIYDAYVPAQTYSIGDMVWSGGKLYKSKVNGNTQPLTNTVAWENVTPYEGAGCVVTLDFSIEGSIMEFDKFGNPRESSLKASYVEQYDFKYQSNYSFELRYDTMYDESDLAGGTNDLGFAYTPFSFVNFNYTLIDKETDLPLSGTVVFDPTKRPYQPASNPGSLIYHGYVDVLGKVSTDISGVTSPYANGNTFKFIVDGITYNGTITDTSQDPYVVTTDYPMDETTTFLPSGVYPATTVTGSGAGLMIVVSPAIVHPMFTKNVKDIPDKSLVWSGVKTQTGESLTKVGTVMIPFLFHFDLMVKGVSTRIVKKGTLCVEGIYGVKPYWIASNFNTVSYNSAGATGWNIGDEFKISVLGAVFKGQILDNTTNPYLIITDIPQTTDRDMSGSYIVEPISPAVGTGLVVNIHTVDSFTYKLGNSYVDPHGGYDPAFYSNSQVDILINQLKLPPGTDWNIIAYSGVSDNRYVKELVRVEEINPTPALRSHFNIPTEAAIATFLESKLDNDVVKNLTSSWSSTGEQIHLVLSNGMDASVVTIPYASSSQDGLIKKEMFDLINLMESKIISMEGLDMIGAAVGNNPTQAALNAAWTAAGKGTKKEGNKIVNTSEGDNQGHNWMYLNMGGVIQWYDIGSGNVAIATNYMQGVVMGTPPTVEYEYISDVVKQTGSAINFIGETLTTTMAGATDFKVVVMNTDSEGNINAYDLKYNNVSPAHGTTEFMLGAVPFKLSKTVPLYYKTTFTFNSTTAIGYVNKDEFTITGLPYTGYVINSTINPMVCIANIPSKVPTDISGTYNTTATSGTGSGLKVVVTSVPYYESVDFRLNVTSWTTPSNTVQVVDIDGRQAVQGVATLAKQTTFLRETKAGKKEIDIYSTDNSIQIRKPEGFEGEPRFDLKFNLAGSTQWVTLTGLLDGFTNEWDLTAYFAGLSTDNVEFYYGDGILIPGIDYTFNATVEILLGGAGYQVGEVVMLNNESQRSAKVIDVDGSGQILEADITTALPTPTAGTGADLSAKFNFVSIKEPSMNSAKNRTFMAKAVKLALISELSGVTGVVDPTGTIDCSVGNNTATISLNVSAVLRANSMQPCYINLPTPTRQSGIVNQGSIVDLLTSLTNNVKYLMDNSVFKYDPDANRIELAIQDPPVTQKPGVDILKIAPSDIGQHSNP